MKEKIASILLILLLILGLSSCNRGFVLSNEQIASSYEVLSVQERWEEAVSLAESWDQGAYLDYINVDIPLPKGKRGVSENVTFHYKTKNNDYISLMISCNEHRCKKIPVEQEEGFPVIHSKPVTLDDFSLDSMDAFKVGLEGGGKAYLSRHNATLILFLFQDEINGQEKTVWSFSVTDFATGDDFLLLIDASTGDIIEKQKDRE